MVVMVTINMLNRANYIHLVVEKVVVDNVSINDMTLGNIVISFENEKEISSFFRV